MKKEEWGKCKNILIVRGDNVGDLLMSAPAIRAVKNAFSCKLTLLTSTAAAQGARLIPAIDEVITADLPWVKKDKSLTPEAFSGLVRHLAARKFDGGIILTVYSQSSLPAALSLWMAGIPLRLGYCRENPYDLLNYWLPDKEPYTLIRHQVERELYLLKFIGVDAEDTALKLSYPVEGISSVKEKLDCLGIGKDQPYLIFHAGVSEEKRKFPKEKWVELARETIARYSLPVLFTGSGTEQGLTQYLQEKTGKGSYSLGGRLEFPEFAALIARAKLLVSVNTAAVHLAAGMNTPVIVLYARTNPQHTPWNVKSKIFEYSIPACLESQNEVIRFVHQKLYAQSKGFPHTSSILSMMNDMLHGDKQKHNIAEKHSCS